MQIPSLTKSQFNWFLATAFAVLIALFANYSLGQRQATVFSSITNLDLPVAQGSHEPSLFPMTDGRILMSWTEPIGNSFAVKTAIGDNSGWTQPQIAVQSSNLYVNWADFPSVAAFPDGTLAVHWLMKNGSSSYDYDLNVALSSNNGRSWGDVVIPHRDGTRNQHGFATLLPVQDRLLAIWLDGRAYKPDATGKAEDDFTNAMQLRATTIGSDGSLSNDTLLDARTCTCCQTSAAVTDDGIILVAYRDRTAGEIRDISLIRQVDGVWSKPKTIHADGWEISGCPVNGPAIDTEGDHVVVAWYTAANDIPVVNVAFSKNAGENFGQAIRIDKSKTAGRVDVLQLGDGSALVSWVEWTSTGEALLVCRARPESGCSEPQVITLNDAAGGMNFPRMVLVSDSIYIAWTQPVDGKSTNSKLDVTIKMVFAKL